MAEPAAKQHDLLVVGAGPGGYIAAIRAAQLGLDTACVDENEQLGGTCLRVGCIPSKALLESSERFAAARHDLARHGVIAEGIRLDLAAMQRRKTEVVESLTKGVRGLFAKNKVTAYRGRARLAAPGVAQVSAADGQTFELRARHGVLAPGTRAATLRGVELDGDRIGTSTEALEWHQVPGHLVVIGAGYIGLELGTVWSRLGARVTVLEALDRILPGADHELARQAQRLFERQGLAFALGARVTSARRAGEGCVVECEGREPIPCDRLLLAIGRFPATDDLGLDRVGLALGARGVIPVDARWQTPVAGIHAIGDAIGGLQLAHKAEDEGVACVEHIATGYGHVNYDAIPGVVSTQPELAGVGSTEEQLAAAGTPFRKGTVQFRANARARAAATIDGLVKVLVHAETDRVLGVHILGAHAGELIAEAVAAIEFGASAEDLFRTSHAHPTLAEALKEAALATAGRTLNV